MRVVTFTEASKELGKLIDEVVEGESGVIIRGQDAADVVLLSLANFDGLKETVYLLESPANGAHLECSKAQLGSRIHARFKAVGGVDIEQVAEDGETD
ncbi:type II toxin-antitoxin system Phd/YefM family antitoxin [Pseudomonas sp. Pseusp97]|uniref:type II toxin-antitoxin system Phd/YefM family antitoxin n=1 Tax=Pseudomonas sp. Pseusp97 TaxID=3243065 RepID=UPI0039A58F35